MSLPKRSSAVRLGAALAAASLAACGTRPQAPPPSAGAAPAPASAAPKPNRLFPAADLGLIEPPDREQWQSPDLIMDDLGIADGNVVADLGAGGGWFTVRLARRVGPNGLVYAIDVQPQMIETVRQRVRRERLANVRVVLGSAADPLPPGLDAVLAVGVYHEMACAQKAVCEEPIGMLENVARSLKPQGRFGVVDFFPGDGGPGPAPEARVDPETVVRAASAAGLQLIARKAIPPFEFQYLLVFGRPSPARAAR